MTHNNKTPYCWLVTFGVMALLLVWFAQRVTHVDRPQCTTKARPESYPFKAGDVLLCPSSLVTRLFSNSIWGHVALVYRDPYNGMLYAWETRIPVQGTWNTITTSLKSKATRLTPLFRYLKRSPQPICVRSLLPREVDTHRLADFVRQKWNQPFGFDFVTNGANRVFMDVVGVPVITRTKGSARYCAELIAETLHFLGVLDVNATVDPHVRTNTIIPRDFSEHEEHLPFANGFSLGPEVLLSPVIS